MVTGDLEWVQIRVVVIGVDGDLNLSCGDVQNDALNREFRRIPNHVVVRKRVGESQDRSVRHSYSDHREQTYFR